MSEYLPIESYYFDINIRLYQQFVFFSDELSFHFNSVSIDFDKNEFEVMIINTTIQFC
jgi:hypothetical protein